MGDRFYFQQLNALGNCPGASTTTKRKRKMAWDDDKKAAVIAAYEEAEPTPENSMEIVKDLAEEYEESPNGVRMILIKAPRLLFFIPVLHFLPTKILLCFIAPKQSLIIRIIASVNLFFPRKLLAL